MDPTDDQLERTPGSIFGLGTKDRAAGRTKTRAAKNARRLLYQPVAQNRGAGEPRGDDDARAGGPIRRRALAPDRTRSAAVRLRPVLACAGLQTTADLHRDGFALAALESGGCRRRADA